MIPSKSPQAVHGACRRGICEQDLEKYQTVCLLYNQQKYLQLWRTQESVEALLVTWLARNHEQTHYNI